MAKLRKASSLLNKYSKLYEKNPRSRVFAPLAESYRKLGMIDEALKILREGIKRHPSYVMGYTVLAHCYFDRQNFELAYNTIRPFVSENLENISLQKLFAQICVNLGYLEEALQTFKYLLLINPKDEYVSEQVKLLEDDLLAGEDKEEPIAGDNIAAGFDDDEDEWVQVNFNSPSLPPEPEETIDAWSMERPKKEESKLSSFKEEIKKQNFSIEEHSLDDTYYYEEYDNDEEGEPESEKGESPIITHTLVDLYIRQGHLDKAAKLLESILELHPEDRPSQDKLESVKAKMAASVEEEEEQAPDLANLVEEKVKGNEQKSLKLLENKLNIFLQKLKNESNRKLKAL